MRTISSDAEANGRDLTGFEWMLFTYCSIRRDGDRARDDVAQFLGRAYGDKPAAMLERIAPAGTPDEVVDAVPGVRRRRGPPLRRLARGPRRHARGRPLAAEEVLPRLSLPVGADVTP